MSISSPALQSLAQITKSLREIIPLTHPEYFKTRIQNNETITYIPWYRTRDILDQFAPGWELIIKDVGSVNGDIPALTDSQGNVRKAAKSNFTRVFVVIVLSIPTSEGIVQRTATGYEDFDKDGYGDPFSNSSAMALGRAAAMFGLGIDLYDRDKRASIGAGAGVVGNGYTQQQQQQSYQSATTPPAATDGVPTANHNPHKGKPITDPSIDLGWLVFVSDPTKAERINPKDRAVYQAELARRQSGGAAPAVMTNPPASYAPAAGAPTAGTAHTVVVPAVPPATTTASPSNGVPRSNDEIKVLFETGKAVGQDWSAIQMRCVAEFGGRAPKELTVGEFGVLTLMVANNKNKSDVVALAAQHLAGAHDPAAWGANELSLLQAMI